MELSGEWGQPGHSFPLLLCLALNSECLKKLGISAGTGTQHQQLIAISTLREKVVGSEGSGSCLDHVFDGQLYEMAPWGLEGHDSPAP